MVVIKRIVIIALLIVSLAAASFVAGQRARVESRNKAVDLVLDYSEIEQLAAASGQSVPALLKKFKKAGATAVAITEQTMRDVIQNREVVPIGAQRYAASRQDAERIAGHLQLVLPAARGIAVESTEDDAYAWLAVPGMPQPYLEQLPIGLHPQALDNVREAGLEVVARLVNYNGAAPAAIDASLRDVKEAGIKKIVFYGDQVLGFRGAVEETAKAFEDHNLLFGMVEFSKQKGERELAATAPGNVIIVHSINSNEMVAMGPGQITERFQKAVRERGVRLVYVRMFTSAAPNLVAENVSYVGNIAKGIRSAGYSLKSSHSLGAVPVPSVVRAVAAVGVAAGVVALLATIIDLSTGVLIGWLLVLSAACAGLAMTGDMGRKLIALAAALVFPTLAAINAVRGAPAQPTPAQAPLRRAVFRLWGAIATTALGGIIVVALLSNRDFMLRIDQFAGVKVAHLIPILLLAALFTGAITWRRDTWPAQKRKLIETYRSILANPMLMWQAVLAVVLLGVVGMMVMRSGNEGLEVSGLELRLRSLLDRVLLVRPRTKEFLIGYPALLAGIAFALRGRRRIAAPLVVVGAIGLVSALNTFCHIHTPLIISGLRVVNGAVVGTLVGMLVYWIVRYIPGREK